jgi:radical SAM protein with 4Fe4S-binding SPASM domain
LKEFKSLNGKDVVFTGGEPTLNGDLVELCEYVHELGMHSRFITNGLLLGTVDLDRLLMAVDEFGVSFDCMDDEILKTLWGTQQDGLSNTIITNFQRIDETCRKINKVITIKIMPIVSKINASKLDELVAKLVNKYENIIFRWSLTKYDRIGKEVDGLLEVTNEEYVDYVIRALRSLEADGRKLAGYAYSYDNKLSPSREQRIITCAPSFFISNDGSTYPCQGCEREEMYLGNVWDNSLTDLFRTDTFGQIRNNIVKTSSKKCKSCELLLCCSMVERPCRCWETDNCKDDCIERMFIDALVN